MQTLDRLSSGTDRQRELELESFNCGVTNFRNRTGKHASNQRECQTEYGRRCFGLSVEPLEQAIQDCINAKKPGRHQGAVHLLKLVDPSVAARITARCIVDGISTIRCVQGVALRIGRDIQDHLRFSTFKAEKPQLFHKVQRDIKESPQAYNDDRCRRRMSDTANKFKVPKLDWPRRKRLRLGTKLIELFTECVEDVKLTQSTSGKKDGKYYITAMPALRERIRNQNAHDEGLSPLFMPMVCPPQPWTTLTDGGYLTRPLRRRLVKGSIAGLRGREMPKVFEAVNTLQATPWKVNVPVWTVVKALWEAGLEVKGFPPRENYPEPARPADFETNPEAKAAWKMERGSVFRGNLAFDGQRMQTARITHLAEKFSKDPAIWFPMQLDFRGRLYPIPRFLNPQGCDLAKGLLTFAEGKPLGPDGVRWLAIHLANTYGYDKCSLDDRQRWAFANSARIKSSATDPIEDRWWMDADKPFQFLAACIEWLGFLREQENYVSSLPIMVDGSCNGLQHLSAMLRDDKCGGQVNLVPRETPADLYSAVAERLVEKLQEVERTGGEHLNRAKLWQAYGIDRKLCKKPVMILPYGGARQSFMNHIRDRLVERQREGHPHPFGNDKLKAINFLTTLLTEAMKELVVGPTKVMSWLKQVARKVSESGEPVKWSTPTGFYVQRKYRLMKPDRVAIMYAGREMKLSLAMETDELDSKKQNRAVAANFVHSLDAAALMFTICDARAKGLDRFAAVHDSYGTVAADMQCLLNCLREAFVRLYEENDVLEQFRVEVGAIRQDIKLPRVPAKGTLDLRGVLKSDFFFA